MKVFGIILEFWGRFLESFWVLVDVFGIIVVSWWRFLESFRCLGSIWVLKIVLSPPLGRLGRLLGSFGKVLGGSWRPVGPPFGCPFRVFGRFFGGVICLCVATRFLKVFLWDFMTIFLFLQASYDSLFWNKGCAMRKSTKADPFDKTL